MKNGLFDRIALLEVLHHDPLQQRGRDLGVPDSFRIDDNYRPLAADAVAADPGRPL